MQKTISVLAVALAAIMFAPTVHAQGTGKPARIAIMRNGAPPPSYLAELRRGLKEHGYIEGKGYVLIPAWAKGQKKHRKIANSLIGKVDLIVTEGTPVTRAAAQAAAKVQPPIPVVFVSSGAPVRGGLVKSLSAPGGHVTGIYSGSVELMEKRVEILKQMVPGLKRMAKGSGQPPGTMDKLFQAASERAARKLGIELVTYPWKSRSELPPIIEKSTNDGIEGWVLSGTPRTTREERKRVIEALLRARMPSMFGTKQYVTLGALASYATNRADQYNQAAAFVDKILKGAKPANLPVQRPAKSELVINLKTAKALGLNIPPSILLRADEVIE